MKFNEKNTKNNNFIKPKKVVIASGKGGTGKTTIAVNLALTASEIIQKVTLIDCDVETPNAHLFLKNFDYNTIQVKSFIPEIDLNICNNCGKCSKICKFNSIIYIHKTKKILFFQERCHGCGACMYVCPQKCITRSNKVIGNIYKSKKDNLKFIYGLMNTDEILSPVIIKKTKKFISENEFIIIDAPPGTSCPVVQTIINNDLCILVAESTPFGLYDLKLAVKLLKKLKVQFTVLINKHEEGKNIIIDYCKNEKIKIIGKIPYSEKAAKLYSEGLPLIIENEYKIIFDNILNEIALF